MAINPMQTAEFAILAATDPEAFAEIASQQGFRPSQLKIPGIKVAMDLSREKPVSGHKKIQDLRQKTETTSDVKRDLGQVGPATMKNLVEDTESAVESMESLPKARPQENWGPDSGAFRALSALESFIPPNIIADALKAQGLGPGMPQVPAAAPVGPGALPVPIPPAAAVPPVPVAPPPAMGDVPTVPPGRVPAPMGAPDLSAILPQITGNVQQTLPPPFMGGEYGRGTGMPAIPLPTPAPVSPAASTAAQPIAAGTGGVIPALPPPIGGLQPPGVPDDRAFVGATAGTDTGSTIIEALKDFLGITAPVEGNPLGLAVGPPPSRPAHTPVPISAREPALVEPKTIATQEIETAEATKPVPSRNTAKSVAAIDKEVEDAAAQKATEARTEKIAALGSMLSGVKAPGGGGGERMPPSGGVHFGPIQQGQILEMLFGKPATMFAPQFTPFSRMF